MKGWKYERLERNSIICGLCIVCGVNRLLYDDANVRRKTMKNKSWLEWQYELYKEEQAARKHAEKVNRKGRKMIRKMFKGVE